MPIEFSCPSCNRPYRVKDELAGKTAKCGKCGNPMSIPTAAAAPAPAARPAADASRLAAMTQQATGKTGNPSAGAQKPAATAKHPAAAAPRPAAQAARPAAPRPAAAAPADSDLNSFLDEELAAAPPAKPAPVSKTVTCRKCGATQPAGAILCGTCGADVPADAGNVLKPVPLPATAGSKSTKSKKRVKFEFKLGHMGTLIRGTALSMVFAFIGAIIWAVVAIFTMREFGIIAWAMGGLAGFGMALGHDDDDGTTAGIIAAFVSLIGIVVAKILIVVLVVAALVAAAVGGGLEAAAELEPPSIEDDDLGPRENLILYIGRDKARMMHDHVSNEQIQRARDEARKKVDTMSDDEVAQELEKRRAKYRQEFFELQAKLAADEEAEDQEAMDEAEGGENDAQAANGGNPPAIPPAVRLEAQAQQAAVVPPEAAPGFVSLFFKTMFNPIDGLWMLLAFATAYKVGSGKQTD
jgi:hypothetical protein